MLYMFGIILIAAAGVFEETGTVIGKYQVAHKKESLYAMGFLSSIWAAALLLLFSWFGEAPFIFSFESLPFFVSRVVLEVLLLFVSLNALLDADRSTFSFLRVLTIPLLLSVDIALGYSLSLPQIAGISFIVMALLFLFFNHSLGRKGKLLSLLSAILAVATISLYKYDITHYNSVVAEQSLTYMVLLVVLVGTAWWKRGENLFSYLTKPLFLLQSLASGIAGLIVSFAFLFAPASIIMAARRSIEVLASIVSGRAYFHEKHPIVKLVCFLLVCSGLLFLTITG